MPRRLTITTAIATLIGALAFGVIPQPVAAQGCEPIRFTTPVNLGGQGQAYQPGNEWQLTLAYRRLVSNQWFVDTQDQSTRAPGGQSPVVKIHSILAEVAYSFSDRYNLRLSVPLSIGSSARRWPDGAVHAQKATGIGDASLLGEAWLLAPRTHPGGNVSLGIGVKAPTGSHDVGSKVYTATGSIDWPAGQEIQPGDGGWGVMLQSQAFRQISANAFGYASGFYLISPKARTDVRLSPTNPTYISVPDVYSARLGGAFAVLPDQGLTMSLGGRVDGIPVHDLVGGGDESTIKRTSLILYADPGLSLTRGNGTFTLSVPYRLHANRVKSELEQRQPTLLNGGGFARYLVFASYMHRL
jgi:hypothetical protein